ncbi:putative ABC transport system permease protein [Desulfobaculum xiamenense]|uniref:Putative ABC transport system permease protein n=1 Tax=Desulfobaculum xiamenense TaxID=995050 RepID=A0A846QLU9_9BACT|nr:ABC transporter permease [Desulfobaculum xiamenense]NJB69081.1 putative ABC transport system permease protein [Desulfobaculum xiamenense]
MHFSLRIAANSLRTHKVRTILAVLGVFLGALALTGVQHLSEAMVRKAEVEIEKLGPNLFMARSGRIRWRRGSVQVRGDAATFSMADAHALLDNLPSTLSGAPFTQVTMDIAAEGTKIPSSLIGTTPDYRHVRNTSPEFGRFFSDEDVERRTMVCVLGRAIAERLFRRPEAAVGQEVAFYRARLRVIGVMQAKGADIVGTDQDEQVFVPISTYMRRMANTDAISGVYIELAPGTDAEAAKDTATAILRSRHGIRPGQDDDFAVLTARDTIQLQTQALELVGTLGLISSTVSFAVGGLGILSIMILLVRARRMEIGIRRAVGARRTDIVLQFLFEAGLLSGMGGILGVASALGLVSIVYAVADFPFVYRPVLMGGILTGSVLLGLAAGVYPAWQASRFEVLDILRDGE